ncbi:hypothetical protein BGZ65_007233, partial [Modicella reniformis]
DALVQDLKEGGIAKNWNERERVSALQALKTLGRATEGCDSIFTEERSQLSNESQFLFCRILFLVTIDTITIVKSLIDDYHAVDNVGVVLKTQLARSPDGTMFTQSMVLSEALKYLFNLMVVDPKIERSGEVNFTEQEKTQATGKRFQSLLPTIVSILITIPLSKPNPLEPPHSHAIHVLLNFPISTSALLVTRSQQAALLNVLTNILDVTLKHSLNTDEEASTDGLSNGTDLDEILPPLILVLTNIAAVGAEAKAALKARLLPDDVDRSRPLDKGDSFSARLIRRMTSVRFPQIRETVSQLLFVVCDENPSTLTRHVGYGNAAGFLMNRNLGVPDSVTDSQFEEINDEAEAPRQTTMPTSTSSTPTTAAAAATAKATTTAQSPPTSSQSTMSNRRASTAVNPITGAYYPDPSAIRTAMADMTEEEKEEEAARLLDMFDRMRRTGVMEARNPALEAGLRERERDRYYDEQEQREQEEEEELERMYGKV